MDLQTAGLISAGIAGLSGLIGASIGGLVTASVARSSAAHQWNSGLSEESRTYYVEIAKAINDQYLALAAATREMETSRSDAMKAAIAAGGKIGDRVDFRHERTPETKERIEEVTSRFRDCLAKRVIYAEVDLNSALEALDSSREVLTDALNVGSIEGAQKELDHMGALLKPTNRAMQRAVIQHNIVAINTVHPRCGRRKARKLLLANLKQLNDDIESPKTRNHWFQVWRKKQPKT